MKGMLRILEAIIGCVLLLTALSFFFGMKTTTVYWDESKIRMEIRDVLMSMYASGKLQQMIDNNEINNIICREFYLSYSSPFKMPIRFFWIKIFEWKYRIYNKPQKIFNSKK